VSDEFKKPVENLKISYDYVNEMLDIQYDINMKFIKDVSDALDVEIIGMLTPSQLKKNAKVVMLLEVIKKQNLEIDYMYEQLGNKTRITKMDKKTCSVAKAYQEARQALKEFNGEE